MIKVPVTFVLMSTTKGHFGLKYRYQETLKSFGAALPFGEYARCMAHIKVSLGEDLLMEEMTGDIQSNGFDVWRTKGIWAHGQESHHLEYLKDAMVMVDKVSTPYVLMVEDDWLLQCYEGTFIDYLNRAVEWLEDPGLVQVRIPRYSNELDRVNGLMGKHGLNRYARKADNYHMRLDDFSMNPALYRTRDLRAALHFVQSSNMPKHIEHGLGYALKLVSGYPTGQFACFNPEKIRVGHVGTLPGEEDDLSKGLIAT